jgi:hypothetical protein
MIMEIRLLKEQSEQTILLLKSLSLVFPDSYSELIDVVKNAKHGITLEVKPIRTSRTRHQENYYRKWCNAFAKYCGMTPDEMHDEILCQCYGSSQHVTKMGLVRRPKKRSGDTSKGDYSDLIETLYRVAAEMGFNIPPPEVR